MNTINTHNASIERPKPRIMIFCDSYLPGYKGGGGMWAVFNLADRLKEEFDFFIVTRDCDGKLDQTPFVRAARDKWNERSEAKVFYASPARLNRRTFESLVHEVAPDIIYLNSVFSYVCVKFLLTRRKADLGDAQVVIAPCGEFANAALSLKSTKKRSFLAFAKIARLFEGVVWKASADDERVDIVKAIGPDIPIEVVPELAPGILLPDFEVQQKPPKIHGEVRLIYFSRITRKKNLLFLLLALRPFTAGKVFLDIVGPTDDEVYLQECLEASHALPSNIDVHFHGGKQYESGLTSLIGNHFMVFPTQNENFGYVIIEALAAGCPVIASDQIIWKEVEDSPIVQKLPLQDDQAWLSSIRTAISLDQRAFDRLSLEAREFAVKWLAADDSANTARKMFRRLVDRPAQLITE